jgi:hypothetical protein
VFGYKNLLRYGGNGLVLLLIIIIIIVHFYRNTITIPQKYHLKSSIFLKLPLFLDTPCKINPILMTVADKTMLATSLN